MLTKNYNDLGLTVLRIGLSTMMLSHGIPKLSMLSDPSGFADPIGVGPTLSLILTLIGEVLAPVFILIGFKTKIAAIPVIITMFVAAFVIHLQDDFSTKEKAMLYLIGFIVVFLAGPGKFSLDHKNS